MYEPEITIAERVYNGEKLPYIKKYHTYSLEDYCIVLEYIDDSFLLQFFSSDGSSQQCIAECRQDLEDYNIKL